MLTDKPRLPLLSIALTGFLPSFLKCWIYRLQGYRIGKGVKFGLGSVLIGKDVEIGDHSSFGLLSVIRGERIRIGNHVEFRAMSIFDTPHLEIGDGTRINEQVFVGGLQSAKSKLIVGRNCQIMQMTFINPARSITIGDDSGIGGHCLIFGHSSWLSEFEGYPVDFEDIVIGKSVSLTWRVFVLPGTKIGDGAVIGANSLVRGNVPGRCLAVGFPARVVSREPDFPRPMSYDDKRGVLEKLLVEYEQFLTEYGFQCRREPGTFQVQDSNTGKSWLMKVAFTSDDPLPAPETSVFLSLATLSQSRRDELDQLRIPWIDIASKDRSDQGNQFAEETVQFLRRYGVRLYRPGWPHAEVSDNRCTQPEDLPNYRSAA
jgi:acetyltransferase-like isoleucine patch superfamily enzyme